MFSPAVYAMQKHFLTFFPDTCMWSNLGRSDLILLSVTFYNFMPLFLVIACYNHLNYSSTFWNSQLASTWTYIISFFFQAPCYLCCLFFWSFSSPISLSSPTELHLRASPCILTDLSISFYCDTAQDWKQYILFGMSSGIERNQCLPQLWFDAFPYIDKNLVGYFFFPTITHCRLTWFNLLSTITLPSLLAKQLFKSLFH